MISPEQAQYFFTNTEDSVCVISNSGEVLYANPAAEKLFDIPSDSGIKIWKVVPFIEGNDGLIQLFIDAVSNKVASHEAIVDYVKNDGKVSKLHVRMTCYEQDNLVYLIVITDLTQLMKVNSALVRYTSAEIADYALTTEEGQKSGGQTKNLTILMSDLRGFTALSSKLSAAELITVLNHYFEAMVDCMQRNHGTLIEFLGDGIFVIFGAPKDLPDHATCAVRCAVEMQKAMKEVNEWNRKNGYPELEMGIGINTGDVVVGNIGSEEKMKYGCMGSDVNIAGRLESYTIGGQVFITEKTRNLITDDLFIVYEGLFLPKGAPEELRYFQIGGIGDIRISGGLDNEIVWHDAPKKNKYKLYFVEGKTVADDAHRATEILVSQDGRFAVIESKTALKDKQNIMLCQGNSRVYAKVIRKEENDYIICFTSSVQIVKR